MRRAPSLARRGRRAPLLLVLLLAGCGGEPASPPDAAPAVDAAAEAEAGSLGPEPCNPLVPRRGRPQVWLGPEGLEAWLQAFFAAAREELLVAVYELDAPALLEALGAAAERGVRVGVVLDGRREANAEALAVLPGRGVQVRAAAEPFPYYHLKVLVRDGEEAVVGSANLNTWSMRTERNHLVRLDDPHDVQDLRALLEADLQGAELPESLRCTRLLLSPEQGRERLEALAGSAGETLWMQQLSFSDGRMRRLVASRAARGVQVRVLLADAAWIEGNAEAAGWLRERGVQVRFFTRLENHAKLILVDGSRAYVGSHNLSRTSLDRNREVGLVLGEPEAVAALREAFEADWAASR